MIVKYNHILVLHSCEAENVPGMITQKVFQKLDDITPVLTAHSQGSKFVFLNNNDTSTALTQFAYGKFMPGESSGEHKHPTMEECFFFIHGEGIYTIDGEDFFLSPNCFIRIPPNINHNLKATGSQPLEFVYFGVAV